MQNVYGIIGYPLGHSFSPAYFSRKFAAEHIHATYRLFPLEKIELFPFLLADNPDIMGLSVTIPYKEEVISYLDDIDKNAAGIGAVNCIVVKDGRTKGHNTDIIGFENSLLPLLQAGHKKALVLGTGGSSKAVRYVLEKFQINYISVSRSGGQGLFAYEELSPEIIKDHTLIINTTPLGMYPDTQLFPSLPYYAITDKHLLFDLIYNPTETVFLKLGKQHGAIIKNGYEMLEIQAEASWDIWNR